MPTPASSSAAAGLDAARTEIRPGALSLLTPPEKGLVLAIIQADRCGRGGDDLEGLSKSCRVHDDPNASAQLSQRLNLLAAWQGERR